MPDPRCRNCLKEIAEKTIRLSTDNKKEQKELINFFNNYIDDHFESMHLPDISTDILQLIAKKTETIDPFHTIKKKSNENFIKLLPLIKEKISTISNKKNRLKLLFLYSIGANMVDFSTGGHTVDFTKIMQNFLDFPSEGLAINDFKKLYKNYTKANEIIFLSDNCGEIVIDNLIVKQMVEEGKIVYLGLKGAPIANDCMIEDFQEAGLQNYASNLFAVSSAYGWNLHEVTTEFKKLLNNCDLLIVKGQSNFESTLNNLVRYPEKDFPPLYCVLRTKCEVITERLGVPLGSNIIKQMYPLKESEKTTLREIID